MKRMDVSCVSHASTAILRSTVTTTPVTSADRQPSSSVTSSSLTTEQCLGGRTINRHNPIIADSRRTLRSLTLPAPSTSSTPINPVPYHQLQPDTKERNSFSCSSKNQKRPTKQGSCSSPPRPRPRNIFVRSFSCSFDPIKKRLDAKHEHGDFNSPPGSSRYLLSESNAVEGLTRAHSRVSKDSPVNSYQTGSKAETNPRDQSSAAPKPENTAAVGSKSLSEQVVVLRVSMNCRGCEGKVRKHLSRMAGVTSFDIDFAAKKVTVVGDVTPDAVLSSVSRVKYAQFWTSPACHT